MYIARRQVIAPEVNVYIGLGRAIGSGAISNIARRSPGAFLPIILFVPNRSEGSGQHSLLGPSRSGVSGEGFFHASSPQCGLSATLFACSESIRGLEGRLFVDLNRVEGFHTTRCTSPDLNHFSARVSVSTSVGDSRMKKPVSKKKQRHCRPRSGICPRRL